MIPALIGAAVIGAGVILLSDDEPKQSATQSKHRLTKSEEQQKIRRLKNTGRIKAVGQTTNTSQSNRSSSSNRVASDNDFGRDFERIENMFHNPNINRITIKNELETIRLRAKRRGDDVALNFVDYYRDKLRNR